MMQAAKVVNLESIPTQGTIVRLNIWEAEVNPSIRWFPISKDGLISRSCRSLNGLTKRSTEQGACVAAQYKLTPIRRIFLISRKPESESSHKAVEIPQVVYQNIEDQWIPIQSSLSLQFGGVTKNWGPNRISTTLTVPPRQQPIRITDTNRSLTANQIPSQATLPVVTTKRSHGSPTKLRLW